MKCPECVFDCRNKDVLCNQLRSHNIYACDFKSNSLHSLNGHVKIHKQKDFKCSECEDTFKTHIKLSNHMKIHTGGLSIDSVKDTAIPSSQENAILNSNAGKRCLSASPEVCDDKKVLRNSNNRKDFFWGLAAQSIQL